MANHVTFANKKSELSSVGHVSVHAPPQIAMETLSLQLRLETVITKMHLQH